MALFLVLILKTTKYKPWKFKIGWQRKPFHELPGDVQVISSPAGSVFNSSLGVDGSFFRRRIGKNGGKELSLDLRPSMFWSDTLVAVQIVRSNKRSTLLIRRLSYNENTTSKLNPADSESRGATRLSGQFAKCGTWGPCILSWKP